MRQPNTEKEQMKPTKKRNMVVVAMMQRSAKAGRHTDKKKQVNKKACRKGACRGL